MGWNGRRLILFNYCLAVVLLQTILKIDKKQVFALSETIQMVVQVMLWRIVGEL